MITGLDLVRLAALPGTETALRAFCGDLLGVTEIAEPPALAAPRRLLLVRGRPGGKPTGVSGGPRRRCRALSRCAEPAPGHSANTL